MVKKSPTVERMVAVLNFFLEHPQQTYTLAQVVKSLHLNRATTHSILLGFVDAGYLYRRSDKSYILGPVIPSLAANAKPLVSPLAVAVHEIRALADDLKVVASVLALEEGRIAVKERAASVEHLGAAGLPRDREYPLHPWGGVFLTGLPAPEVEARLDRERPAIGEAVRRDVLTELEFARRHGFIAALFPEGTSDFQLDRNFRYLPDLAESEVYAPRYLVAPIFGAAGEVALAISLFGFPERMTGSEIFAAGRRLLDTTHRVTTFVRGRPPAGLP